MQPVLAIAANDLVGQQGIPHCACGVMQYELVKTLVTLVVLGALSVGIPVAATLEYFGRPVETASDAGIL